MLLLIGSIYRERQYVYVTVDACKHQETYKEKVNSTAKKLTLLNPTANWKTLLNLS